MKRSRRVVERLNVARSSKVREGRGDPGCWVWRAIEGSSGGRGAFVPCIGGFVSTIYLASASSGLNDRL